MRRSQSLFVLILTLCLLAVFCSPTIAAGEDKRQPVRVGFFSSEGYHMMDKDGTMSGYGYDFLQMMLRYNDWAYDYVGYDSNWGDMMSMLDNGQIDMLTLANKTPEREARYAYSDKSIGVSSTVITASTKSTNFIAGDYSTYNNAVVGLVAGSSHNSGYATFAAEHGISATTKEYDNIDDLLADLRAGKNIDLAVTSNMRVMKDEVVLDEFNPTDYYVIVRKSDTDLLEQINRGIDQMDIYSPGWRTTLFSKYYSNISTSAISLSNTEKTYLKELKTSKKVITATMNPELRPYSWYDGDTPSGIVPILFKQVADKLDIEYKILHPKDRSEYKKQLSSGEADLDLTAFLDYSIAQKYDLKETDAYLTTTMAALTRRGTEINKDMTIAVTKDPTEYAGFSTEFLNTYTTKEYSTNSECVEAVQRGTVDATFCYVYSAKQAVATTPTNSLEYTIMPDYSFGLCIGVKNGMDHRLLSVLNKGVNSLENSYVQSVMLEQSSQIEENTSPIRYIYDHPAIALAIVIILALLFVLLGWFIMQYQNRRQQLKTSNDLNRFIGYICKSYESFTEIDLVNMMQTFYHLENNKLEQKTVPFTEPTREGIATNTHPEDVERMADILSISNFNAMLDGHQDGQYVECSLRPTGAPVDDESAYSWYSYIIETVPADENHPRNIIIFKKDITEAKTNEAKAKAAMKDALMQAQSASAAKGSFLSRMSHEIRTPLNAIIGYMQIAKDASDSPEKMMHCVDNSDVAAKHLLAIINDILDISAIESGRMKIAHEDFNLRHQITTLSTLFYNQSLDKDVRFEAKLHHISEEWVVGDSLRLSQILMNLLSNAVKFTPAGGSITLSINQNHLDDQRVYFTFAVSDTGIGMSDEYKDRLFTPFEQESATTAQKYGGSGLGLSITANLIQMMGGNIEVDSTQGKGTTFTVGLYFDRCQTKHPHQSITDFNHVRVLVVDDDPAVCEYMKALFKQCHVKCDVVHDGPSAVRQVRRRSNSDYAYDLCILDWQMPDMDGIETAKAIREIAGNLPIIIATAYDATSFMDEAKDVGVQSVVSKPLFASAIFDLLVDTCGKYEPAPATDAPPKELVGLHLLLAEDNPMNQEIAIDILTKSGMTVKAVDNGKQAVDTFTKAPAGTYAAILMDVQMPIMDGYAATDAIRHSGHPQADIPIIAMTANAFAEDVNDALAAGMNGHIAKPVDYDKLYAVLSTALDED